MSGYHRYLPPMASPRSLNGSVIALVGASGGLGRALDRTLTDRGAALVRANRSGDGAEGPIDVVVDVRSPNAGQLIVDTANERAGRLDGVVVAAGVVAFGDVATADDVIIEELMLTNSMGPLWIAKRTHDALAASKGFFVNVSGMIADTPMPGMAAYAASKAAAAAALTSLRKEWRRERIDVLDARPPHTETGLVTRALDGSAPTMPKGLEPTEVAERIVAAIEARQSQILPDEFD